MVFVFEDDDDEDTETGGDDEIMLFKGSKSGIFGCSTGIVGLEGFVEVEEGTVVVWAAAGLQTCPWRIGR